ncbi:MAG: sugar phosphate isomerase/epimerase family protein [Acidobacteriota bacterium]
MSTPLQKSNSKSRPAGKSFELKIGAPDWNLKLTGEAEAVELSKRIGFDGVEISLGRKPSGDRLPLADPDVQQRYLDESRKHNVPIVSTCLDILHVNFLKSDPLGQKWVMDSIPITKKLGARVILLPFFGNGRMLTRAEMDFVADFLKKEAAAEATRAGVVLGLENTNSAEENAYILDRVQSDAVRVYYDVGNSTGGGFDVVGEIGWLGRDRICQFHLKDNPHYLGEGSINFPAVIKAIAAIGFKGVANLECSAPSGSVEQDMKRNLAYVRGLLAKAA